MIFDVDFFLFLKKILERLQQTRASRGLKRDELLSHYDRQIGYVSYPTLPAGAGSSVGAAAAPARIRVPSRPSSAANMSSTFSTNEKKSLGQSRPSSASHLMNSNTGRSRPVSAPTSLHGSSRSSSARRPIWNDRWQQQQHHEWPVLHTFTKSPSTCLLLVFVLLEMSWSLLFFSLLLLLWWSVGFCPSFSNYCIEPKTNTPVPIDWQPNKFIFVTNESLGCWLAGRKKVMGFICRHALRNECGIDARLQGCDTYWSRFELFVEQSFVEIVVFFDEFLFHLFVFVIIVDIFPSRWWCGEGRGRWWFLHWWSNLC